MAQGELWSTLLSAIDPFDAKAMPAVLQSTINLLESELATARAALEELQLQPQTGSSAAVALQDEATAGAIDAYKYRLLTRASKPENTVLYNPLQLTAKPNISYAPATMKPRRRPDPLLQILSNSLVLDHMVPYLPVSSLLSLASTSTAFRSVIMDTPYVFRHMDLRKCRGAQVASDAPIDSGGQVWRRERMDEALTEDDFYSGPLRGIFSDLQRRSILQDVRTLILDGLAVPTDLVTEILTSDRFKVNILSIRDCRHLNERKLMQSIKYAVRPSRPQGTPRVKGIYYFGARNPPSSPCRGGCSRCSAAPRSKTQTGDIQPDSASHECSCCLRHLRGRQWYEPTGRILDPSRTKGWAQILQLCQGIISFDAVLCRSPRHDPDLYASDNPNPPANPLLLPAIASTAVGPSGCAGCGTAPEGPAVWDESPDEYFPLLEPPPIQSSTITTAKCPSLYPKEQPTLILRCEECIASRRCYRCKRWWCSTCAPNHHQNGTVQAPGMNHGTEQTRTGDPKFFNLNISRDCWECGPTCGDCKAEVQRTCITCLGDYCVQHNDGCSPTKCDWCCNTRRTRELY